MPPASVGVPVGGQASPTAARGRLATGAHRMRWEISGTQLLLLFCVLFAGNVFLHYPGTLNNDSINQYRQAVTGQYADWHPPVMAWLWSWLRLAGDGPGPFLVLHLALYWLGLGLMADGLRRAGHSGPAMLMAVAGVFPPFLYINGTVVKDVGVVVSWLAAVGLMFWFRIQQRRIPLAWWLAIAPLLAYGLLVRTNAVFAFGPLLAYALAPPQWLRSIRLMAIALVIAVFMIPVTMQLNQWFFKPVAMHPVSSLMLFDLAGMAVFEKDPALLEPRATLTASELQSCYSPYWWDSLSPWGRCSAKTHRPDADLVVFDEGLTKQWATTIATHPLAYVVHRLKHFNSSLLFAVPLKHIRLTPEYRTDDPAIAPMEVVTERDIRFDLVRKNPLFWPVTWLAGSIFLLVFLSRETPSPAVLLARVLVVSGLGYSGAYLVIGVATDMRYHYWSLMAILVATFVVAPQLLQGWRRGSRPLRAGAGAVALVVCLGVAARLMDFRAFL